MSKKLFVQDPTEHANKRKAQIDRAKQLREERNSGIQSDAHTFTPQLNKRPSYLNNHLKNTNQSVAGDSLDNLTNDANNIFEKPLPGKKTYAINNQNPVGPAFSPNSDALGMELKKYSPRIDVNANVNVNNNYNPYSNNTSSLAESANQFKNKINSMSNANPNRDQNMSANDYNISYPLKDKPASQLQTVDNDHEIFQSILRSNSNSSRKQVGNGWNDDFTALNSLATNDSITAKPRLKVNNSISSNSSNGINANNASLKRRSQLTKPRDEWNSDYNADNDVDFNKSIAQLNIQQTIKQTVSPRLSPRGSIPVPTQIMQARSRLSLLKSKIRKSESGGGLGYNSSNFDNDLNNCSTSVNVNNSLPRTAPSNEIVDQSRYRSNNASYSSNNNYNDDGNEAYNKHANRTNISLAEDVNGKYNPSNGIRRRNLNSEENNTSSVDVYKSKPASKTTEEYSKSKNLEYSPRIPGNNDIYNANKGNQASEYPDPVQGQEDEFYVAYTGEMMECPDCSRKFNPKAFEKHSKICKKVFLQKRKVFDSKKMRIEAAMEVNDNAEAKELLKKVISSNNKGGSKNNGNVNQRPKNTNIIKESAAEDKSKWKEQSNYFRDAMKQARLCRQAEASGKPLPPPIMSEPDPSLVQCPHCSRRFNEKAAERHIPVCTSIRAKPAALKKGTSNTASSSVGKPAKSISKPRKF